MLHSAHGAWSERTARSRGGSALEATASLTRSGRRSHAQGLVPRARRAVPRTTAAGPAVPGEAAYRFPREQPMNRRPRVISLFSGAGGLDYGLEAAGIDTAVALEMDRDCCETLRKSRPKWGVIE